MGDYAPIVISETKPYYLLIWLFIWIKEMEREQEVSRWEPSDFPADSQQSARRADSAYDSLRFSANWHHGI